MIIYVLEYSTDQQVSLDRPAKAGENGLVWGSMEREGLITAKSSFNSKFALPTQLNCRGGGCSRGDLTCIKASNLPLKQEKAKKALIYGEGKNKK